MNTKREWYSD